jgi:hypothetical protein
VKFIFLNQFVGAIKRTLALPMAGGLLLFCGIAPAATITNSTGLSVALDTGGNYTVQATVPAWAFGGSLGATPAGVATNSGADDIGAYSEIVFSYVSGASRSAAIRLYQNSPIVLFTHTYLTASTNDLAFPQLTTLPGGLNFVDYQDVGFFTYDFGGLHGDSPWMFFDTNYNSFVVSPAANFMIANDSKNGSGVISCGINSGITNLPSGFTHRTILVVQNGINNTFETWGNALTSLSGKTRPANDAAVELNKLGYWTDNGATYYYNYVSNSYPATLLAVRDEFASKGLTLGYMQLDSWWYPKGAVDTWQGSGNERGGIYQYIAAPELFTNGLASFQQQLGLPLMTHSRWIDPSSPYNSQYLMSTNASGTIVSVDPTYWTNRMAYLQSGGVVTYEQDWLNQYALPAMNLNDPPAFMNDMASAANSYGINMQYCLPLPRNILQGSLYNNLLTTRASDDIFVPARWDQFIYDSRLASALGTWPWTDVYFSSAIRSLLISTLSAGPVGVGDALGAVNVSNLACSVRADSVIVKPDVTLVPMDFNYVNDAQGANLPLVSSAYTDHNGLRNYYVFAYARTAANPNASFTPAQLGMSTNAYVYDYFNQTGIVVAASSSFNFTTTTPDAVVGGSYFIVSPVGPSGLAFIGDANKFITAGKKRISTLTDSGSLQVTVTFAASESNVTLLGYSSSYAPQITANHGTAGPVYIDGGRQFTVSVSPDGSGTAAITLNIVSNNLPQVTTPTISPSGNIVVGAGTNVTFTEALLLPQNNPPFTYQWQSNNVSIGSAVTTSSATNLFSINATGFVTGTYNYSIIVSNATGSVTSAPAVLNIYIPGPVTNFTLNYGGTPIVQPVGSDWNTPNNWSGGNPAKVSEFSNPHSSYEVVVGSRLRTPAGTTGNIFPGDNLVIDGSGVFENGTLNAVGELRFKNNNAASTNYFSQLVLNGGQLDIGDNTALVVQGQLNVSNNSSIYVDSTAVNDRGMQIDSWLTGSGNLFWHEWSGSLGGNDLRMTYTSNTFSGQWLVDQGALLGVGANSLGTNNILVGMNGLTGAVETLYDIHNTNGSLILGPNGTVFLHQNDIFKSVLINAVPLATGTYSFATLNSAYPASFPSSWTLQNGSTVSTGSGSITVLANPAPIIVTPPQPVSLYQGQAAATFSITAAGAVPLGYRWFTNGTIALSDDANRIGSTSNALTIPNPTVADSGFYTVVVTNNYGSVTSAPVALTVSIPSTTAIALQDGPMGVTNSPTTSTNLSMPFTVTPGANVLVVTLLDKISTSGGAAPATLSWNGQTLTRAVNTFDTASIYREASIYYLFNPATDGLSHNITGSLKPTTVTVSLLQAFTLNGVDTNAPPVTGAANSTSGTSSFLSFNVTVVAGSWAAVGGILGSTTPAGSAVSGTGGTTSVTTANAAANTAFSSGYISGLNAGSGTISYSWTLPASPNPTANAFVAAVFAPLLLRPQITGIELNGATLSVSATNGMAGGSWILLQSSDLTLPLNQWQTNSTGNFDGSGHMSTNIINPATNSQEFYIFKVQ